MTPSRNSQTFDWFFYTLPNLTLGDSFLVYIKLISLPIFLHTETNFLISIFTGKNHTHAILTFDLSLILLFVTDLNLSTSQRRLKVHPCPYCNLKLANPSDIQRHIRVHTGEKPYNCGICGKSFTLRSSLKVHQRTHTGEKLYSCEICGKAFSIKHHLSEHIKIHTGEEPYSCEICGRCFSRNSNLKVHQRTHTGEKLYSCEICRKSFTRKHTLKSHVSRTHH